MGFKTGHDANRYTQSNGVMQFHKQMAELLRSKCLDAVDFVVDTMNDEKAPLKLRMVAAKEVLDRGMGRPIDVQVHMGIGADSELKDVNAMTDSELEALARTLTPTRQTKPKTDIIDADFTESQ